MKHILILILAMTGGSAFAASGTDPSWPCIQRKQPHLSLGQVWTGPEVDEEIKKLAADHDIGALADRIEQRRVPLEEAEAEIAEFAKEADNARLAALMLAVFDRIEPERIAIMSGIGRYGESQVELSAKIEARRAKMAEMEAADEPDFDAIDAEEEALDWDQRIFTERQQALTYVCESPVLLEQRVFAIGRSIAQHLD